MKAEDLQRAQHRPHVGIRQPLGADFDERIVEDAQVRGEFLGVSVAARAPSRNCETWWGANLDGQPLDEQLDKLPPRLAEIGGQNRSRRSPMLFHDFVPRGHQRRRQRLHPLGKAQLHRERGQLAVQDDERIRAQAFQRFGGHLRGHAGMAVAIATHPRAEANLRQMRLRPARARRVEPGLLPGVAQALVEFGQHRRENVAQVVHHVAALVGERRLFEQDFARCARAVRAPPWSCSRKAFCSRRRDMARAPARRAARKAPDAGRAPPGVSPRSDAR